MSVQSWVKKECFWQNKCVHEWMHEKFSKKGRLEDCLEKYPPSRVVTLEWKEKSTFRLDSRSSGLALASKRRFSWHRICEQSAQSSSWNSFSSVAIMPFLRDTPVEDSLKNASVLTRSKQISVSGLYHLVSSRHCRYVQILSFEFLIWNFEFRGSIFSLMRFFKSGRVSEEIFEFPQSNVAFFGQRWYFSEGRDRLVLQHHEREDACAWTINSDRRVCVYVCLCNWWDGFLQPYLPWSNHSQTI